jgi:hypothetical protein
LRVEFTDQTLQRLYQVALHARQHRGIDRGGRERGDFER